VANKALEGTDLAKIKVAKLETIAEREDRDRRPVDPSDEVFAQTQVDPSGRFQASIQVCRLKSMSPSGAKTISDGKLRNGQGLAAVVGGRP
jgi:hypothetical protein